MLHRIEMNSANSNPSGLPSFRLDGCLAVITGAGDGLGRTFAVAFARSGAEVVLVSRTLSKLQDVQRDVEAAGGRAHVVAADVSKLADIRAIELETSRLLNSAATSEPQKLILVNCAGFGFTKAALDITEEDWDRTLDVHAKGTFFCSQHLGRLMIERGYGKIINLSSTWSTSTDLGKSVYGAAKAGISYLTSRFINRMGAYGHSGQCHCTHFHVDRKHREGLPRKSRAGAASPQPYPSRAICRTLRHGRRRDLPGQPGFRLRLRAHAYTLTVAGTRHYSKARRRFRAARYFM